MPQQPRPTAHAAQRLTAEQALAHSWLASLLSTHHTVCFCAAAKRITSPVLPLFPPSSCSQAVDGGAGAGASLAGLASRPSRRAQLPAGASACSTVHLLPLRVHAARLRDRSDQPGCRRVRWPVGTCAAGLGCYCCCPAACTRRSCHAARACLSCLPTPPSNPCSPSTRQRKQSASPACSRCGAAGRGCCQLPCDDVARWI